ncbi:transposase [Streptomyces sp. SRF1]|uniref:transposase n=1 Tax=Streptomyces sp. SRF1 TaxID=1549642 RepID=UPI00339D7E74
MHRTGTLWRSAYAQSSTGQTLPDAALVSTASAGTSGQARCSRWRTRAGAPWRDVPERYGPWDRVYDLFRRWQRDGTWAGIVTRPQAEADAKGLITWDVNVDSTVCRAHQRAAGASKKGTCGRSRPAASPSSRPTTGSDVPGAG